VTLRVTVGNVTSFPLSPPPPSDGSNGKEKSSSHFSLTHEELSFMISSVIVLFITVVGIIACVVCSRTLRWQFSSTFRKLRSSEDASYAADDQLTAIELAPPPRGSLLNTQEQNVQILTSNRAEEEEEEVVDVLDENERLTATD